MTAGQIIILSVVIFSLSVIIGILYGIYRSTQRLNDMIDLVVKLPDDLDISMDDLNEEELKMVNSGKTTTINTSYVISNISNGVVKKDMEYPIVSVSKDKIEIDVNGQLVELEKYDKDFSFFIHMEGSAPNAIR